jgi:hypothetical protein
MVNMLVTTIGSIGKDLFKRTLGASLLKSWCAFPLNWPASIPFGAD